MFCLIILSRLSKSKVEKFKFDNYLISVMFADRDQNRVHVYVYSLYLKKKYRFEYLLLFFLFNVAYFNCGKRKRKKIQYMKEKRI